LITGPTALPSSHNEIETINVVSAQEMYDACMENFPDRDICVMSAAVADFTPAKPGLSKIKKSDGQKSIELKPTVDILASLGKIKKNDQVLVGFALETEDEENNAISKLHNKNLDLIVLNSLNDEGAGFGHDTNKVTIINRAEEKFIYDLKTKEEVATDIVNKIIENYI